MPDPRQKLYKALSNQYDLGTFDEFNKKMDNPESRKKLYSAVSKSFDLGSYDEFESKVKKKEATQSIAQAQKSASAPQSGSSGIIGQNNPLSPSLPSQTKPAKQPKVNAQTTESNTFPEGSPAWTQARLLENDPSYRQIYDSFKQAEVVPEDKLNAIKKEVDDEANNVGVLNKIRTLAAKGASYMPSWLGGTSGKDVDPLYKEKEQAKKELQQQVVEAKKNKKQVPQITDETITERAKQIKVEKRVKSVRESQVSSFLSEIEKETTVPGGMNNRQRLNIFEVGNKSTLQEKDKQLLKKQELLRPALESSVSQLRDLQKKADSYVKSDMPIPDDLKEQYNSAFEGYQMQLKDAIDAHEEYVNNKESLGSAIDNLDVFKRDYSWSKNFLGNLYATSLDLSAGVEGAVDYLTQFSNATKPLGTLARAGSKESRAKAKQVRDEIMKPIAVEDINSMEDFGKWFSNTVVANQIPIYAMVAAGPGGVAAIGTTSTGQKYEDMLDEIEAGTMEYSDAQLAGIPLAFGATETASALVDRMLLKNASRTIRSATESERKLIANGFWNNIKSATSAVGKGGVYEGLDEAGTQIAQNLIDKYAGDKESVVIFDGVKDAGAAGAVMGIFIPFGANVVSSAAKPFTTDSQIENTSAEIQKLEELLNNPELEQSSRTVIEKQYDSAENKLRALVEKTAKKTASLSNEEFEKIISIEKAQGVLKKQAREILADGSIDQESKDQILNNLKDEFNQNENNRLAILNKPVNEPTPNEATQQEAQPQTEEQAKGTEELTDTEVNQSNNNQLNEPTNTEDSQENTNENPNSNQIRNEAAQGENIETDGGIRPGTAELGEMGEETGPEAEAAVTEGLQPTAEPGTSEIQPDVNNSIESNQENTNFAVNQSNYGLENTEKVPDEGAPVKLRSSYTENSQIEKLSNSIREGARAGIEKLGKSNPDRFDLEDSEKSSALSFAKENDLWIEDFYTVGKPLKGGGNENTLAFNPETGKIYKSNNLFNSKQSISQLLDQVAAHNELFPETKYEVIGFTGIDKGADKTPYVEVILSQDFISDAVQATPPEIKAYMESLGFTEISPTSFRNEEYTVSDLHPRNVLKDSDGIIYVIDDIVTRNVNQATESNEGKFEKKPSKKSILNRLYEGETSETIKTIAENSGLTYEIENQDEAEKKSKAFVDKAGINGALEAVRTGQIKGAEAAFVYGEILDKIQEASDNAEPHQREKIEEQYLAVQTEATNLFDQQARESGRFISALNRIYNNSKIKYALSRQIERYKAVNGGEIPADVLAKFKEADAKIKELEKQIAEAEKRAEEAEQKAAMQNIIDNIEQQAAKKPISNRQAAKKVANNIRKLKITRPDAFNAVTVGAIWDAAVEIVAKTVEAGGTVADGINKAIDYIKKTKWYKGLSDAKKADAENQFRRSILDSEKNNTPQATVNDGVLYIPDALIRILVESGVRDINELSQSILDTLSEAHPEITLREVRDAITKYGKTINPTKDEIQKEINLMKRLGRLISGLEDVDSGKRPSRTGLQREKLTQEERKLQRELREKMRNLPLDHADLEKQWKNALDTVKSRLKNQIEDLEKQIEAGEKRKPERTSLQYDSEAIALKGRRDELRDLLDEIAGKPELTDEQRVQRAINLTENAIEKLRKQIESGDIGFNPAPRTLSSPELNALKATRRALAEQLNQMRSEAGLIEKRKLKQAKDRLSKRINELQDKVANRDYSKREVKPIAADEELIKLQAEKIRWQEIYDRAAYETELKNRSFREKSREAIVGALNIFRILKATGELSPILIQGGVQTVNLAVRKPKTLLRAFGKLLVALGSSRKAEEYDAIMKANDMYGIMKTAKLGLVEPDYKLELREEQFIGNYINNIWNLIGKGLEHASGKIFGVTETMPPGDKIISFFNDEYKSMPKQRISEQFKNINPLLALERGLTTYMNELRIARFEDGVKMLKMEGKNISENKKDFEKLAAAINTLTGRANIGRLANISDILSTIFFSFRNTVSIINQINPYWYATLKSENEPWYKPSVAQKVAVYDMIRFITLTTSAMFMLKAAAGDDEEGNPRIEIETDPRSSDFLKMKQGNMRFDAFHGMIPMVVFFTRQFTGETKSKGVVKELGSGRFTPTRADLLVNMGANKLSPQAGIAYRYANTKVNKEGQRVTKYGEPYDLAKELSVTPIYIESLLEISKEDPDAYAQFLTFMGLFGVNSQVYDSEAKKSSATTSRISPDAMRRIEEARKRAQERVKRR